MIREYGFHPDAFNAYVAACQAVNVNPHRVLQTIGNAEASAGTHKRDGYVYRPKISLAPIAYTAATDISVSGLTENQIHGLLSSLADNGIAGYYRHLGSFANNRHVHFVFAACKMKLALRDQIHDWLHGKDGLANHGPESFYKPTQDQQAAIREGFLKFNQAVG